MKKLLTKLTPKTILNKVNLVLTGVFFVMLAGMLYMKSFVPVNDPDCPPVFNRPPCPYPATDHTVFFPHPNDPHWFFECFNGVAYCMKCPADLVWSEALNNCVFGQVCETVTTFFPGRYTFSCYPCELEPNSRPVAFSITLRCSN